MLIFLGILGGLLLVLAMPLDVNVDAVWPESKRTRVSFRWALGLLRFDWRSTQPERDGLKRQQDSRADSRPSGRRQPRRSSSRSMLRALSVQGFRRRLRRFCKDLWAALHLRDVQLNCRVGLDTPADTGMFWGAAGPVAAALHNRSGGAISLVPDFSGPNLDVRGQGQARVFPLQVIGLILALMVSPSLWQGISASRAVD